MTRSPSPDAALPAVFQWTPLGRFVVFLLSATSIWCLLAEFYGLCSMRAFTLYILIPATALLVAIAFVDLAKGDRRLFRACAIGAVGGLLAAVSYDLFRLPFVVAATDHIGPLWLRLPLYKVFPQFGAMILGQPFSPSQPESAYPALTHLVGWVYHFSNGVTFGVMYMAIIGSATRRSWLWAIALAVGLELAMLVTPYTAFFGIGLTTKFVVATLTAHFIFGVALGLYARRKSFQWPTPVPALA